MLVFSCCVCGFVELALRADPTEMPVDPGVAACLAELQRDSAAAPALGALLDAIASCVCDVGIDRIVLISRFEFSRFTRPLVLESSYLSCLADDPLVSQRDGFVDALFSSVEPQGNGHVIC